MFGDGSIVEYIVGDGRIGIAVKSTNKQIGLLCLVYVLVHQVRDVGRP